MTTQAQDLQERIEGLEARVEKIAAFREQVRNKFSAGSEAPDFALLTNIDNAIRFADMLAAIERAYFTHSVHDEENEGEFVEECELNSWGLNVEEYVKQFGYALERIRNESRAELAEWLENEVSAIDPIYRGSPTYERTAGWMKDQVRGLIENHPWAEKTATPDGWIEWNGGACPVDGGAIVEVKFCDSRTYKYRAGAWYWSHDGLGADIIAYRVCGGDEAREEAE